MNHRDALIAALATVLLPSGFVPAKASAADLASPSPFALPVAGVSEIAVSTSWCPPALGSIYYRPRHRYREREHFTERNSHATGFSQIHGGFFDPEGDLSSAALFGFRAGGLIDDHVQLGLGLDWSHRSDRQSEVISQEPLPGGGTSEVRRLLARSSSNLFPMMAFLQIAPGGGLPVVPYFGIGGGYEVLFWKQPIVKSRQSLVSWEATRFISTWGTNTLEAAYIPGAGSTNMTELVDDQGNCAADPADDRRPEDEKRTGAEAEDGERERQKRDGQETPARDDDRHRTSGHNQSPARPALK